MLECMYQGSIAILARAVFTMAAGHESTILLRSDGQVVALGGERLPEPHMVPQLPAGVDYAQVAASCFFVVLLRSDGIVTAWVPRDDPDDSVSGYGNCHVPELPAGTKYEQASCGAFHLTLLRSDGNAVIGNDDCDYSGNHTERIPPLPNGLTYIQVSGGYYITVLLRSDGLVLIYDHHVDSDIDYAIPELPVGVRYTQVSAGFHCALLLRSDGHAVAVGENHCGQCAIPELPEGTTYTNVSAGKSLMASRCHNVLLRSDGQVAAIGSNDHGQCNIPDPGEFKYIEASAGGMHTVLLRSDGQVSVVGDNSQGQAAMPELAPGLKYVPCLGATRFLVQVSVADDRSEDELKISCHSMSGDTILQLEMAPFFMGEDLHRTISSSLDAQLKLQIVLPSAELLTQRDFDVPISELLSSSYGSCARGCP